MIEKGEKKVYNHHSYEAFMMITMKRVFLLALILIIGLSGCAGRKKVKPTEDSITARNALNAVSIIRDAYVRKEKKIMGEKVAEPLAEEIVRTMTFDETDLSFTTRFIRITAEQVMVQLNWQGIWTAGGNKAEDRGSGTLVFQRGTMKLSQVEGDNPFIAPGSGTE